ncbi:MBL fold metallo-hydrolase [Paenibacillus eucommiae]|uniref:beta-lactamase n=1 Tax=Paenibacillus eucommiae TaxID=1355755 RepID=A0ABS4J4R9_9BACL|nr:MBL fold metallo-hydrolase [Paenibacillus eucommiae]MBP1994836.1 glyoxylase-like metal-dependent hydrolase (beta-lactamase superfamily II) [Paenibacillus eucommiae]
MKITDRIYIVGSGNAGMQLSHNRDCNVYILDCGSEYVLIDAGVGLDTDAITRHAEQDGIDLSRLTHLLLTHPHGDHAGGASYFQSKYGLKVLATAEAAPWLEQGDMEKTTLADAIRAGLYPDDFILQPCPVSQIVKENDKIQIGDAQFQVLETPGHSDGHASYLWELDGKKLLFSGDAIFAGGKIYIQNSWDCSIQKYAQTMAKLNELKVDMLFAGHGPFLLNNAWKHIETAHQIFERLDIPPNI